MTPQQLLADPAVQAALDWVLGYNWPGRGQAPIGYIKGMACVFGKVYCDLKAGAMATTVMARADTGEDATDALAWYSGQFDDLDMPNDKSGRDTLRHLFVLITGLGMRESSGEYWCGRDLSAGPETPDETEAGLFQMSYNIWTASPLIPALLDWYSANPDAGLLPIFKEGLGTHTSPSYGSGAALRFQDVSKCAPAFAAEAAAVGLRVRRTHWGPINRHEARLSPAVNHLFLAVQAAVDATGPQIGIPVPGQALPLPAATPVPGRPIYDAADLARVYRALNIPIDVGNKYVNIAYVEGFDQFPDLKRWTPNANRPDAFDSQRIAWRMTESGVAEILGMWNATTHAGRYYEQIHLLNSGGAFHIAEGMRQTAWKRGIYHGPALVQVLPLYGTRDLHRNFLREGPTIHEVVGCHHHYGGDMPRYTVGEWAAGCQVGEMIQGHQEFMRLIDTDPRQQAGGHIWSSTVLAAGRFAANQ